MSKTQIVDGGESAGSADFKEELAPVPVKLADLFRYATPNERIFLFFGFVGAVVVGAILPVTMVVMESLIDEITKPDPDFGEYILIFCICGIVAFVFAGIYTFFFEKVGEMSVLRLKDKFFNSLTRQDVSWYDTSDPAQLAARVVEELSSYREGNGVKVAQVIQFTITFLGCVGVGFWKCWEIALINLAFFPFMGVSGGLITRFMTQMLVGSTAAHGEAGAVAEEALSNIRTVQSFGREEEMTKRYDHKLTAAEEVVKSSSAKFGASLGLFFIVMFTCAGISHLVGGYFIADSMESGDGKYTPARVMISCMTMSMGMMSFGNITNPLKSIAKAKASLSKILAVAERIPKGIDSLSTEGATPEKKSIVGNVTFKDIKFRYPAKPNKVVLNGVSFTLEAGKTTALVGASGSGKSSCAQLLMRYYDPEGGSVSIDGHDLKTLRPSWWRETVGIVQQEPKLFATTIAENIRLGKPGASIEEIMEAARKANAHDFIMKFPLGYDTEVGQSGGQLSGGQKQRVAIARAIIRDPKVLILDEATSALDNQSEKVVQEALDDLMAKNPRTTMVIAHRLTTIRRADKIVVFEPREDGSVIKEEGNHDELMKIPNGIYRKLVETHKEDDPPTPTPMIAPPPAMREGSSASIHRKISLDLEASIGRGMSGSIAGRLFLPPSNLVAPEEQLDVSDKSSLCPQKPPATTKEAYVRTFGLIRDSLIYFLPAIIGACIHGAASPVFGLLMGDLVGAYYIPIPKELKEEVVKYCVGIIAIGVVQVPALFVTYKFLGKLEATLTRRVRKLFFNSMLYQDGEFFDAPSRTTGALINTLTAHTQLLKEVAGNSIALVAQNITSLLVALIVSFTTSWEMTLGMLAGYCILIPGFFMEAKYQVLDQSAVDAREAAKETTKANSAGHLLSETVASIRVVHALTAESELNGRYREKLNANLHKGIKSARMFGIGAALSVCAPHFVNAIAFGIGGVLIRQGKLDIGQMFRCFLVMLIAGQGLAMAAVFMKDQARGVQAAKDIFAVVDRKHLSDPRDDATDRHAKDVDLDDATFHFRGLKFFYPTRANQQVYNGVTFSMPPGKTTALVGASGSGKSTIVQLLQRYYVLKQGLVSKEDPNIQVDGKILVETKHGKIFDLKDIPVSQFRDQIGLVGQEPALFKGSVEDNIMLGARSDQIVTKEEVLRAVDLSNAKEFISRLQGGLESDVGRYGAQLSGGQKQRVAIARAIIRDPKVLILDEATSALDNESEKVVQAALDDLLEKHKRTTLVIAHRLTTIRRADQIVVFEPGPGGSVIKEVGTHEELMKKPTGIYRRLVEAAEAIESKG